MIIPSIDLSNGRAVQLIGGEEQAIDAGNPTPLLDRFGLVGEVAVIDLDAAKGEGDNSATITELLQHGRCRVGGGIRDYEQAVHWLDAGAEKIILGSAAEPGLLRRLPRGRLIAALDERQGAVVDHGWRRSTGRTVVERLRELRPFVGGFLITFVDVEGQMRGLPLDRLEEFRREAGDCHLTIAGGTQSVEETAAADRLGVDVQVGMALYSGRFTLADSLVAMLRSDRDDGLWPTVICDEGGVALGLAYSNAESLGEALATGQGVYWSRSRNRLWRKGESSGATQRLQRIDLDCDRDALRFVVQQAGPGFCHKNTRTCFGAWADLNSLEQTIRERAAKAPVGSYTSRLLSDRELLSAKLVEEAEELALANTPEEAAAEAADLLYFLSVALVSRGAALPEAVRVLNRRRLKISRRPGDAKRPFQPASRGDAR
ncbi:MAG: phosphoribosyl-ATP diphosphatase [Phycisphaerales bacterium JB038]